jgi:hypothetical protein
MDLEFGLYIDNAGVLAKVVDSSLTSLQDIFTYLQSNAANDTSYVIQLVDDSVITSYASKTSPAVSNVTVTLQGSPGGNRITYPEILTGGVIGINAGTTFVLGKNITLDGNNVTGTGNTFLVSYGGKFKMKAGSKVTGCRGPYGAIRVVGNDANVGEFIMEGGEISGNDNGNDNDNGTVSIVGASFTMLDGKITENVNRGVYVSGKSTMVMEGGEISNNGTGKGTGLGRGVYLAAGSSSQFNSFTMKGGKIVNNGDRQGQVVSGVYASGRYVSVTLDGSVDLSGNGVNVWVYSATVRGSITLTGNFENLSKDPVTLLQIPIVVDIALTNSAAVFDDLKTSSSYLVSPEAITQFAPGVVFRPGGYTYNPPTVYGDQFTIGSDGVFTFVE